MYYKILTSESLLRKDFFR